MKRERFTVDRFADLLRVPLPRLSDEILGMPLHIVAQNRVDTGFYACSVEGKQHLVIRLCETLRVSPGPTGPDVREVFLHEVAHAMVEEWTDFAHFTTPPHGAEFAHAYQMLGAERYYNAAWWGKAAYRPVLVTR